MPIPTSQPQGNIPESHTSAHVAVIGGGPAGLMSAEVLVDAGITVDVYESMPTLGRKFLRAGLGGLNITHSEPYSLFCSRYGDRQSQMQAIVDDFPPDAIREWVHELGIKTFVGTSGRIFPNEMKAAPLLRAWIHRLRASGVRFHVGHRWVGFDSDGGLKLANDKEEFAIKPDAVVLALGGASWPQLGSDGCWVPWLTERGVDIASWQVANCGFEVDWSEHLREKFARTPLKAVSLSCTSVEGVTECRQGEFLITEYGVEGSLIYSFSKTLRELIYSDGKATFTLDLLPDRSFDRVLADLSKPRGSRSISRYLQQCLGNNNLKRALLYEVVSREQFADPHKLAKFIKALPITVNKTRPIEEAISSAGGVSFCSLDQNLMLNAMPGVFVAGEMIDWEAPTGGYLLTACFGTGRWAARGVMQWLGQSMRD